jgi:hypothetical protein
VVKNIHLILFVFSIILLHSPAVIHAQEKEIKVTGYNLQRSGSALLDAFGNPLNHPAGPSFGSTRLGNVLLNTSNFGSQGIVSCSVKFRVPTNYVHSELLVNSEGKLLVDVFFATSTTQNLTIEEINEFKNFLNAGGILYVQTAASVGGEYYNPLFEFLNLDIHFGERIQASTGDLTSDPPDSTLSTNGPFGVVGALAHSPFREINSTGVEVIAYNPANSKVVLAEAKYGKGYLSVAGTQLHVNILSTLSNQKYFSNLVAMGCNKDNSKVLDVPSFKQGIKAYDGVEPVWENSIYDDGDKQSLWCDSNNNGATMAECGCALTSATMVMKYFGVDKTPNGSDVSPGSVNEYFKQNSRLVGSSYNSFGFVGGNINWHAVDNVTALANRVFPTQTKLDQPTREDFNLGRVKQYIDEGIPVILKVTGKWGIHWVVIKGYDPDTNRLIINDPISTDKQTGYTYLDELYTPVASQSMVIYKETHSDFSSLQFVSSSQLLVTDSFGNKTGYNAATDEVYSQIPNSEYVFDEFVGDATNEDQADPSTNGFYFLTIKTPQDGNFVMHATNSEPVTLSSSNTEGDVISRSITSPNIGAPYTFIYNAERAGEEILELISMKVKADSSSKWIMSKNSAALHATIFSRPAFDVSTIDQSSIRFGKTGQENSLKLCTTDLEDLDGDGLSDLTCKFKMDKTGFDIFTTQAILTAKSTDGFSLVGVDGVVVR